MNLENIMVHERSQAQKTTNYVILLRCKFRLGKSIETESLISGCLGLRVVGS